MKRLFSSVIVLALFSTSAFASKNSTSLKIVNKCTVGSTQLSPGDYQLTWTGTGADLKVSVARFGKVLVTVPAKVVDQKSDTESVSIADQGGVYVLQSIQLHNMDIVLAGAGQ